MEKIRVSAKTKDEAITKALIQLHTTSDRLSYHVLVQGTGGLFGIGAKPWSAWRERSGASPPERSRKRERTASQKKEKRREKERGSRRAG